MFPDGLLGGISPQPLGRAVPAQNRPVQVGADDAVVRALHDRGEERLGVVGNFLFDRQFGFRPARGGLQAEQQRRQTQRHKRATGGGGNGRGGAQRGKSGAAV